MRLLAALLVAPGLALAQPAGDPYPAAVMQGLDKVTARVSTFTVAVGGSARFGRLSVSVEACFKRPPEETPESTAFVVIDDGAQRLFAGWMFASSPALNGFEHPVYDIWVLDCASPARN
ncbi:MAG: hypothetical protein OHK0024_23930 [Thalassobaculales bacterium]